MATLHASIAPFDLRSTIDFLHSASVIRAIAEGTSLEWKTYNDSTALNVAYFLLPWKEKPGSMDVTSPNAQQVKQRSAELFTQSVLTWLGTLPKGPAETAQFMASRQKVRALDLDKIEYVYREARAVNAMADGQLRTAIRRLATVQLAGTISVALLSGGLSIALGAGATVVGGAAVGGGAFAPVVVAGVPTGYSIMTSVIKDWHSVPSAKLVVVATGKEGGKALASEGLGKAAETVIEKSAENQALHQKMLEEATRQVEVQSARIARRAKVTPRAAQKLAERKLKQETAEQGVRGARAMGNVGRAAGVGIPIVFAAWDIWEGVGDYQEVLAQTR